MQMFTLSGYALGSGGRLPRMPGRKSWTKISEVFPANGATMSSMTSRSSRSTSCAAAPRGTGTILRAGCQMFEIWSPNSSALEDVETAAAVDTSERELVLR